MPTTYKLSADGKHIIPVHTQDPKHADMSPGARAETYTGQKMRNIFKLDAKELKNIKPWQLEMMQFNSKEAGAADRLSEDTLVKYARSVGYTGPRSKTTQFLAGMTDKGGKPADKWTQGSFDHLFQGGQLQGALLNDLKDRGLMDEFQSKYYSTPSSGFGGDWLPMVMGAAMVGAPAFSLASAGGAAGAAGALEGAAGAGALEGAAGASSAISAADAALIDAAIASQGMGGVLGGAAAGGSAISAADAALIDAAVASQGMGGGSAISAADAALIDTAIETQGMGGLNWSGGLPTSGAPPMPPPTAPPPAAPVPPEVPPMPPPTGLPPTAPVPPEVPPMPPPTAPPPAAPVPPEVSPVGAPTPTVPGAPPVPPVPTDIPGGGVPDTPVPDTPVPDLPGSGDTGIPQPPLDPSIPSVPDVPSVPSSGSLPDWLPDWAKSIPASVWSAGIQGVLGYLGADAKGDALKDIYNQQTAIGAPYRDLLLKSYQPGFDLFKQPGYGDAFNQMGEVAARSAGVKGNPGTTPSLQGDIMSSVWNQGFLPAQANYRGQLGQFGGMGLNTSAVAGMAGADFSNPWLQGAGAATGGLFGDAQNKNPLQLTVGGNAWGSK